MSKKVKLIVGLLCMVIVMCICTTVFVLYAMKQKAQELEVSKSVQKETESELKEEKEKHQKTKHDLEAAYDELEDTKNDLDHMTFRYSNLKSAHDDRSEGTASEEVSTPEPTPAPTEVPQETAVPAANIGMTPHENCYRTHDGSFAGNGMQIDLYQSTPGSDQYTIHVYDTVPGAHGCRSFEGVGYWDDNCIFHYTNAMQTQILNGDYVEVIRTDASGELGHEEGSDSLYWINTTEPEGYRIGGFRP